MSLWAWLYGRDTTFEDVIKMSQLREDDLDAPERDYWDPERDVYVTGCGQILTSLHPISDDCLLKGCVIHSPTDHPMRDLPTLWRSDRALMERTCPCGVGHPDPDDMRWQEEHRPQYAAGVHGCDGCCSPEARRVRDADREKRLADEDMKVMTQQLLGSAS